DGRPRLEGLHLFLAARGLHVDEETANAIARPKGDVLEHGLERHEVAALPGEHTFLEAAGHARLARAVVSASTTTLPMLQLARVDQVVEARVDAETMR